MGCRNVKACRPVLRRKPERNQGRIVPCHITALPGGKLPCLGFLQPPKALLLQCRCQICNGMEACRAFVYKFQHFFCIFPILFHVSLPFLSQTAVHSPMRPALSAPDSMRMLTISCRIWGTPPAPGSSARPAFPRHRSALMGFFRKSSYARRIPSSNSVAQ